MTQSTCKFSIGQLVHHLLFDYRGVIVDVDATFQGTEEWYEQMAQSRPPQGRALVPCSGGSGGAYDLCCGKKPEAG